MKQMTRLQLSQIDHLAMQKCTSQELITFLLAAGILPDLFDKSISIEALKKMGRERFRKMINFGGPVIVATQEVDVNYDVPFGELVGASNIPLMKIEGDNTARRELFHRRDQKWLSRTVKIVDPGQSEFEITGRNSTLKIHVVKLDPPPSGEVDVRRKLATSGFRSATPHEVVAFGTQEPTPPDGGDEIHSPFQGRGGGTTLVLYLRKGVYRLGLPGDDSPSPPKVPLIHYLAVKL